MAQGQPRVVITLDDDVLKRFGNQLGAIGEAKAVQVMYRALNRGGDETRTQIRRSLVKQTGIKYGLINRAVTTVPAHSTRLAYTLEAKGDETNLSLFGAKQGKRGVSAAPWGKRRAFKGTFIIARYGGKVFKRTTKARFPIKQVYGPNIARELHRSPTVDNWQLANGFILKRIEHEIGRILPK